MPVSHRSKWKIEKGENMNIKRAKQEIIDAVEAYLSKDEYGDWLIPRVRQRPVLLIGAPGKNTDHGTGSQKCGWHWLLQHHSPYEAECDRSSFYLEKTIRRKEYEVTEYTYMSEIVVPMFTIRWRDRSF